MATDTAYAVPAPTKSGPEFYAPKAVPPHMQPLIKACIDGDLEAVRALWRPGMLSTVLRLTRDETCDPLLNAAHHLRVEVVDFLLQQGLNPRQRGTVHPYTGDNMIVAECQGISPLELIAKMLFMHPRKSKRRDAILAVREKLLAADEKYQAEAAQRMAACAQDQAVAEELAAKHQLETSAHEQPPTASADAPAAGVFITPVIPRTVARTQAASMGSISPQSQRIMGAEHASAAASATTTPAAEVAAHVTPVIPERPAGAGRAASRAETTAPSEPVPRPLALSRLASARSSPTPELSPSARRADGSSTPVSAGAKRRIETPAALGPDGRPRSEPRIAAVVKKRRDDTEEFVAEPATITRATSEPLPAETTAATTQFLSVPASPAFAVGPAQLVTPQPKTAVRVLDRTLATMKEPSSAESMVEMTPASALSAAISRSVSRWLQTSVMPGIRDAFGQPAVALATIGAPADLQWPGTIPGDVNVVMYRFESLRDLLRLSGEALDKDTLKAAASEFMQLLRHRWQPSYAPHPIGTASPAAAAAASHSPASPDVAHSARVLMAFASSLPEHMRSPPAQEPSAEDAVAPFLIRHLGASGVPAHPLGISPHLLIHDDPAVSRVPLESVLPAPSAVPPAMATTPKSAGARERSATATMLDSRLLFAGRTPVSCALVCLPDTVTLPTLDLFLHSAAAVAHAMQVSPVAASEALEGFASGLAFETTIRHDNVAGDAGPEPNPKVACDAADSVASRDPVCLRSREHFAAFVQLLKSVVGALILDTRVNVVWPVLRPHTRTTGAVARPSNAPPGAAHMLWSASLAQTLAQSTGSTSPAPSLASALGHRFAVEGMRSEEYTHPALGACSLVIVNVMLKRVA